MGKSKTGGTRSYIRGRVGADVYSIGRDAKGKKQQVVRSLAETVANPQTLNQMRGRMIMYSVMQALAALRPIVDHSFDGFSGRQPNISEFISRNYALVKADVAANPSAGNHFGLCMHQEKGAKRGQFIISDGKAVIPAALALAKSTGVITITLPADNVTVGGLKSALGMTSEEYFTLVGIDTNGNALYERFRVNPNLTDETPVAAENVAAIFATEGNATAPVAINANAITITLDAVATCCAVIISKKANDSYIHNKAVLGDGSGFSWPADVALPSWPVGASDYLNGGDIYGESENFPEGGDIEPITPVTLQAQSMKFDGQSKQIGSSDYAVAFPKRVQLELSLTGEPIDGSCRLAFSDDVALNVGDVPQDLTEIAPITSLAVNREINFTTEEYLLIVGPNNKVVQVLFMMMGSD